MGERNVPAWLKSLGRRALPPTIVVGEGEYVLAQVYKNDFFAVTARYDSSGGSVVLKANRQSPVLGIPLRWIGRWLAGHEASAFSRLAGVEGIPLFLGRWKDTGIIHAFIPGHAMRKGERVPDGFHPRLAAIVAEIHQRRMAYVDLEKCENVLVGDDGNPYLIDFQIAFYWPWRWGENAWPVRWLRRRFQEADRYHLVKLQRRTRPDQLPPEQLAASYHRPWYVHVHRWLTRPFTLLRRAVLNRIDPRRAGIERGRVETIAPQASLPEGEPRE